MCYMHIVCRNTAHRFLTISHNKIKKIENLLCLTLLEFLDLSYNLIDQLEEGVLPCCIVSSYSYNVCVFY